MRVHPPPWHAFRSPCEMGRKCPGPKKQKGKVLSGDACPACCRVASRPSCDPDRGRSSPQKSGRPPPCWSLRGRGCGRDGRLSPRLIPWLGSPSPTRCGKGSPLGPGPDPGGAGYPRGLAGFPTPAPLLASHHAPLGEGCGLAPADLPTPAPPPAGRGLAGLPGERGPNDGLIPPGAGRRQTSA